MRLFLFILGASFVGLGIFLFTQGSGIAGIAAGLLLIVNALRPRGK